jgi:hypothetical protein
MLTTRPPLGHSGNILFLLVWHKSAADRLSCASNLSTLRLADSWQASKYAGFTPLRL